MEPVWLGSFWREDMKIEEIEKLLDMVEEFEKLDIEQKAEFLT